MGAHTNVFNKCVTIYLFNINYHVHANGNTFKSTTFISSNQETVALWGFLF